MSTLQSLDALRRHQVVNADGDKIGHVEDVMFDPETGEIHFLILGFGGLAGLGERFFAVPYDVVEVDTKKERLIFRLSEEEIRKAPGFERNDWPDFAPPFRMHVGGFYEALRKARRK